jgi:molybdenum cofactor cytidylyltransferase
VNDKLAGIVLAAGLSQRMGSAGPKQLLTFGERTMVGHVVAIVETTTLDPIVIVTGHEAKAVESSVAPGRARVVRNDRYREGNVTSLRAGLDAVGDAGAVMLLLADMPGIEREVVEVVAAAWRVRRPFAILTAYEGVPGHPILLSAEAIEQLAAMDGSKPLWAWLLDSLMFDVARVEVGRPKPGDINTIDDYHRELRNTSHTYEKLGTTPTEPTEEQT